MQRLRAQDAQMQLSRELLENPRPAAPLVFKYPHIWPPFIYALGLSWLEHLGGGGATVQKMVFAPSMRRPGDEAQGRPLRRPVGLSESLPPSLGGLTEDAPSSEARHLTLPAHAHACRRTGGRTHHAWTHVRPHTPRGHGGHAHTDPQHLPRPADLRALL